MDISPGNGNQHTRGINDSACMYVQKWLNTNLQIVSVLWILLLLSIANCAIDKVLLSIISIWMAWNHFKIININVPIGLFSFIIRRKKSEEQTSNSFAFIPISVFCIIKSPNLVFWIKVEHFIISIIASTGLRSKKKLFWVFF